MVGRCADPSDGDRLAIRRVRLPLALTVLFALAGASYAGEPPGARSACVSSVFKLCPVAALTGNHDAAKACLLKKVDQASPQCQAALKAAPVAAEDTHRKSS